jgi:Trypsin
VAATRAGKRRESSHLIFVIHNSPAPANHNSHHSVFSFLLRPLVDVNDTVVGVVSWGRADCHPGAPGVFAKVSKGWDWINDQVCANALDIPDWAECAR